jgi:hypothetical protein
VIDSTLDAPTAFLFTGEICSKSYQLNKFAFDFKHGAVRERFANDPEALMTDYGLSDTEKALVRARDWTGLVANGGHHFVPHGPSVAAQGAADRREHADATHADAAALARARREPAPRDPERRRGS